MRPTAKEAICFSLDQYPTVYSTRFDVLLHWFTVNGNGIDLKNGYLSGVLSGSEVPAYWKKVEPPVSFYPWSQTEEFQPFRQLAGCKNEGFLEEARYFSDTVKSLSFIGESPFEESYIEPQGLRGFHRAMFGPDPDRYNQDLAKWKANIHIFDEVMGLDETS